MANGHDQGIMTFGASMGAMHAANFYYRRPDLFDSCFAISGLYLICSILTEMISNNAVAAVMGPLAYEMALQFDANPIPFILAVMFGASASFSTPIGYQTNTYVYNAGGYKFKDFVKVGLPLNLLLWVIFTCAIGWLYPLK